MQDSTARQTAEEIVEEFSFFDDWADRYQHLIDQGRRLAPMDVALQIEENQLKGCQSVVYFFSDTDKEGLVHFSAASDAAIVQGLIALLLRVYSVRTPQEILALSPDFLEKIGLDKHLSPTRKNGLASMVEAIRRAAEQNLKTG
jgi:cysteine desulfuration protein SufE